MNRRLSWQTKKTYETGPYKIIMMNMQEKYGAKGEVGDAILKRIVSVWLNHPLMASFFTKYGMEKSYFQTRYAEPLLNSPSEAQSSESGRSLVQYLKNRDVILSDFDGLFSAYRRALIQVMIESGGMDAQRLDAILERSDAQRQKAMEYYAESMLVDEKTLKQELVRFRQYQKVIDKSAIVSKSDTHGRITYVNQAFCEISGYARDELIGKPHNIVRHPDVPSAVFAEMWETIQAKKVFRGTVKNRKKTGEAYYVDATIVPILDENNDIIEYIGMRYDVTALIEAVEAAKHAQKAKEEFLANMSHEIRTPLNAIMGFVEILRRQSKQERELHYLEIIHSSSQMLLGIVNDVLDLSKLQSGKFLIESLPYNPMDELSAVAALFGSKAYEKSLRYAVYIDPNLPLCLRGDGARIKQVLSNFLSNAIKFTPKGGTIKIKAVYEKGVLNVMVQDNGIGIGPEQQSKIFQAFEQGDGSITRNYGGTGLGLSISAELIVRMGGKILFKSVENKGSLFGFDLPASPCDETFEKSIDRSGYEGLRAALIMSAGESATVALIEKYLIEYGIRSVHRVHDASDGEFDVVFCPDASKQLERFATFKTPVVVLYHFPPSETNAHPALKFLIAPFLPYDIEGVLQKIVTEHNME